MKHLTTQHRTAGQQIDVLQCEECSFKAESEVELIEHKKTTHGVLLYKCEYSNLAIEELWKHKMLTHQAYEASSKESTNTMLHMLLIAMSGQLEYLVENVAKIKIESVEGFKENRIHGDIIEERLKKLESKLDDNSVALAKTTRFDTKIQNDSMAFLTKVIDKCATIENAVYHNITNKETAKKSSNEEKDDIKELSKNKKTNTTSDAKKGFGS